MMCPSEGEYSRRKGIGNVSRTPSVELRVVEDAVLPVALAGLDDSDLEDQVGTR
jgi:hypothetical protein